MKKWTKYILTIFLIFIVGCVNTDVSPIVTSYGPIESQILNIKSNGQYHDVKYLVTPGIKYSVQLYAFGTESPVKTYQLSSVSDTIVVRYDFSDIQSGVYDMQLISIDGEVTKKPLIKK